MSAPKLKPRPLPVDPAGIPDALKERPQWVVWRYEWQDERAGWTKVPLQARPLHHPDPPKAPRAAADKPRTWATFEQAFKAYEMHPPVEGDVLPPTEATEVGHDRLDGVGYVFAANDPFTGWDVDKAIDPETGEVDPTAAEIIDRLDSYAELSPSGTGAHIIVEATLEGLAGRKRGRFECYDSGRFFTVTGQPYGAPKPIAARQDETAALHAQHIAKPRPEPVTRPQRAPSDVTLDAGDLLERMFASKTGPKIRALWDGDLGAHGGDASAADFALASHLLWWCDFDQGRADALFRQSALMRPKWDERHAADGATYGQMTLAKAGEGKAPGDGHQPKTRKTRAAKPRPAKTSTAAGEAPDDGAEAEHTAGEYVIKRRIIHRRTSKMVKVEGEWIEETTDTPLCNFAARITEDRTRDDGAERTRVFVLEGQLASGQPLPPIEVAASQFAGMNWPTAEWGTGAVVLAGQGTKDHLRAALQLLSGDVPRTTTYAHTGWREIEGRMRFLIAGKQNAPLAPLRESAKTEVGHYLHSKSDVSDSVSKHPAPLAPLAPLFAIEAPLGLERFTLAPLSDGKNHRVALQNSLHALDLAADTITAPLFAAVWRAVLGGVDFGLHLAGSTGAGKSELAAIFQQHFGPGLDARHLPASWSSTGNSLEGLAFAAKDTLLTVDDFAPEGAAHDVARYHATAARLFRAAGNHSARGRMRADGSLRPDKPPRALILSTGEDIPKGQSIRARLLILELAPGGLDWRRLSQAQEDAAQGVYAAALAGFIGWLAEDYHGRRVQFGSEHARLRSELQTGGHKRTADAGAQLLAALSLYLDFAEQAGAVSDRPQLWARFYAGITGALEPQAALQSQSDPVARFSELLTALFVSGRVHVADASTGGDAGAGWGWPDSGRPSGARIGWVAGDDLFLEPGATYAELQKLARDQGETLVLTERTLWKRLSERGMIHNREAPHVTVKRSFAGAGRVRVLHTKVLPTLAESGASGASGVESVQDGVNPCPTSENAKAQVGQVGRTLQSESNHKNGTSTVPDAVNPSDDDDEAAGVVI